MSDYKPSHDFINLNGHILGHFTRILVPQCVYSSVSSDLFTFLPSVVYNG